MNHRDWGLIVTSETLLKSERVKKREREKVENQERKLD